MGKNLVELAKKKETTYGIYLSIAEPGMLELMALSGFDFVRIDCEHMLISPDKIANLIRAGNAFNITTLVRVNTLDDITRMLDFGADGFVVPNIKTKSDAENAIELIKYSPLGCRGMMPYSRCVLYGTNSFDDYQKNANERVSLTVQLENKEALENIDDILSLEGIDMVASGKMDLSQALGMPGQITHPQVIEAENFIIKKALEHHKQPAILANSVERANELEKMGVYCFTVCYDCEFIFKSFKENIMKYKQR